MAEIIRKHAFLQYHQEIPYEVAGTLQAGEGVQKVGRVGACQAAGGRRAGVRLRLPPTSAAPACAPASPPASTCSGGDNLQGAAAGQGHDRGGAHHRWVAGRAAQGGWLHRSRQGGHRQEVDGWWSTALGCWPGSRRCPAPRTHPHPTRRQGPPEGHHHRPRRVGAQAAGHRCARGNRRVPGAPRLPEPDRQGAWLAGSEWWWLKWGAAG